MKTVMVVGICNPPCVDVIPKIQLLTLDLARYQIHRLRLGYISLICSSNLCFGREFELNYAAKEMFWTNIAKLFLHTSFYASFIIVMMCVYKLYFFSKFNNKKLQPKARNNLFWTSKK